MLQSEEASTKYCQDKLDLLSKALMKSISEGSFSVPGGNKLYRKAMERLQCDYFHVPRKGVKVRNKGNMGSLQNRLHRVSWNLRAKHHVWVMREHGDIMIALVFKAQYMVFISEEKCPSPTPLKWISKITTDRTEIIHFFIQQSNILCATCWGFMMQSQNLCIQGWIKMQEQVK